MPARIPAAGLGFPKLPSTNWMVWEPKGVWISVRPLKALARLLGCPQADLIGSQSFPVSFTIIARALCVGFLFIMVYWSEQQLLIFFLSPEASSFQCCSCNYSSYCAKSSCNCSRVLLEAPLGTAAAAFVTGYRYICCNCCWLCAASSLFLSKELGIGVSYWQQPCSTHSPSQTEWLCLQSSQEDCWHHSTEQLLVTASMQSKCSNSTQETTTKPFFLE